MEIKVAFTTQLKAAIGKGEEEILLDEDATVRDAIEALAQSYPTQFAQMVFDRERGLLPSIVLCVNDQQVDDERKLRAGDTVTLLSAISGG